MMCCRCPADAEARGGEPYQLPGQRHPGHPGHPRAHQAAQRRGPGGCVPGRHDGPPAQQEGGQPPRHHEQPPDGGGLGPRHLQHQRPGVDRGRSGHAPQPLHAQAGPTAIFKSGGMPHPSPRQTPVPALKLVWFYIITARCTTYSTRRAPRCQCSWPMACRRWWPSSSATTSSSWLL